MNDPDQIATAAHRFYGTHRAEHLQQDHERLIDRCASHLSGLGWPVSWAQDAAMQAYSDLDSADAGGYVDQPRSTSTCVVMRDTSTNRVHVVTARELMALVRQRATAPPG